MIFSDMVAAVEVIVLLLAMYLSNSKCYRLIGIEQTLMLRWSSVLVAMVSVAVHHMTVHMTSTGLLLMDYTVANKHRMAIEHTYRINFASMHNANVLNRPSISTVYYDKLHDLCMHPMCHDLHGSLNSVVELPDFEPLLQLLNLV